MDQAGLHGKVSCRKNLNNIWSGHVAQDAAQVGLRNKNEAGPK
jgi:hypothetical protein